MCSDHVNDKFSETCDEVLETAWSTMWNVTDETPINCERFLDGGGMHLFLRCKEVSKKYNAYKYIKYRQQVLWLSIYFHRIYIF